MSVLGLNLGASITADGLTAGGSIGVGVAQSFSTQSVNNDRLALYTLSIIAPAPSNQVVATYTFPISPASVTREFTGMTSLYDVQGSPTEFGVHRVADSYGNSPSDFMIEGTTGWQRHSTDGFAYTGIESVSLILSVLDQYAQLNALQQQRGNANPYLLEFYDYFSGSYWEVVPAGRQRIRITRQRPLIYDYALRLVGIRDLSSPISQPSDPILLAFSTAASQAQAALQVQIGAVGINYGVQGVL